MRVAKKLLQMSWRRRIVSCSCLAACRERANARTQVAQGRLGTTTCWVGADAGCVRVWGDGRLLDRRIERRVADVVRCGSQ